MKRILFTATNRVHIPRQQLLLEELKRFFDVKISDKLEDTDVLLARGDRYEVLPIVMDAAYKQVPIVHIEGGDLSGVIDNKVRYAITHLSDYHFVTNEEAHQRLIQNGVRTDRVWNMGSLDVEYAKSVDPKRIKESEYYLVAYHPIGEEDEKELAGAVFDLNAVSVVSNADYGRRYGKEEYSPEDYINLMRYATCAIGNSSSLLKEASILGTPVVLVGDRQHRRLCPHNVLHVPCERGIIREAIGFQSKRAFRPDLTYYKPHTSKLMAEKIHEICQ